MAERIVLSGRRTSSRWKPDYKLHDDDLDTVIQTMTDSAKQGKAGDLGYEVIEVQVVRRVHIRPQITAVEVTEETGDG